ncbi:TlpA family protein disulfide reductase [Spongiactinospora sp. 9N601]|uniref:TlpA family protein disulfide reductase n=1 Tax=Spongiactinospora sp. 9N601 TaxID=3375149 RepID=UPI003790D75C
MVSTYAVLIILGMICLINLTFTLGLLRRLREHTRILNERLVAAPPIRETMVPNGTEPQSFTADTLDGRVVSRESMKLPALVAFMAPSCKPCAEALPGFLVRAQEFPGGRDHVIAVVASSKSDDNEVARLNEVAQVVLTRPDGPVIEAFSVNGFPAFGIIGPDGTITMSSGRLDDLLLTVQK